MVEVLFAFPNCTNKKSDPESPPPSPESAIRKQPVIILSSKVPAVEGLLQFVDS